MCLQIQQEKVNQILLSGQNILTLSDVQLQSYFFLFNFKRNLWMRGCPHVNGRGL